MRRPARLALTLLLAINLFNYIDRYVLAAVEPEIGHQFFAMAPDDPATLEKTGSLATAFLISYMVTAPLFGWLADRMSRWLLVGVSVLLWSLASGGSGLASTFTMLLITRLFVGIGEAGYGPAAPTIISDLYPVQKRGSVLAWFYLAIPVGSAIGYAVGGWVGSHYGWRWAFYVVVPPGLVLGIVSLFMRDPPRGQTDRGVKAVARVKWEDYLALAKIPSYVLNTLGMAALTFAIGGISYWMPRYLTRVRGLPASSKVTFGAILCVAGALATLAGGLAGDKVERRYAGAYFLVSAIGILLACPFVVLMLYTPFPLAWVWIFFTIFFLFFNTGPANTILANVTHPSVRASAFAINIFVIHAMGDAPSPPLLGGIAGRHGWNAAFLVVVAVMLIAAGFWMLGVRYLKRDTERISGSGTGGKDLSELKEILK
jgi:MFS family permease